MQAPALAPDCAAVAADEFDAEVARRIGSEIAAVLRRQARATVVLPFGRTPLGAYGLLPHEPGIDWNRVVFFNGDEYVGARPTDAASSSGSLKRALLDGLTSTGRMPVGNVRLLNGAVDPDAEVRRHCAAIEAAGGVDLMVLGIGRGPDWRSYRRYRWLVARGTAPLVRRRIVRNASVHLWFNEAGSSFDSSCRVVELTAATRQANQTSRTRAMTIGLREVQQARKVLLLARGAAKRSAVDLLLRGPICKEVPASVLRLPGVAPKVTVLTDTEARP